MHLEKNCFLLSNTVLLVATTIYLTTMQVLQTAEIWFREHLTKKVSPHIVGDESEYFVRHTADQVFLSVMKHMKANLKLIIYGLWLLAFLSGMNFSWSTFD